MAAAACCRGFQFKATEINDFLALVEEYMPVSAQSWQLVADLHAEIYNKEKRTAESLRHKFQEVCRRAGPTGDPNCPDYIIYAKRLNRRLIEMVDASSGGSEAERSSADLLSNVSSEGGGKDDDGNVVEGTELFPGTDNHNNGDIAGGMIGGDNAGGIAGEMMVGDKAEQGVANETVEVANMGRMTGSRTKGAGSIRGGVSVTEGSSNLPQAATCGGRGGGGGGGGNYSGRRNPVLDVAIAFPANNEEVDEIQMRTGRGGNRVLSKSNRGRAFCTPISRGRKRHLHSNADNEEEGGWSFLNIMGMMMMQQRHDSEAREADLALCQEEMAIRHEESRAQQQMMNTMMMALIQQQQRSFGMPTAPQNQIPQNPYPASMNTGHNDKGGVEED
jgi:hypothetical protein